MPSPHRRLRPARRTWAAGLALLAGASAGLAACVDSGGGDTGIVYETLIAVAPEDFLGRVPCANAPGAFRRYVVTLYDVTDEGPGFALPSSGPVDCALETKFRGVPGRRYVARVDGYDRTDIRPLGAPDITNSGNPVMVDSATGEYVAPRWTSSCSGAPLPRGEPAPEASTPDTGGPDSEAPDGGEPDSDVPDAPAETAAQMSCETPDPITRRDVAVTSVRYLTRRVASCTPLCDSVGPGVTGLSVRIDRALGTLECGMGPGQVASFRVEPEAEGGAASSQSAACGQVVIFTEPREFTLFKVTAFESGNPAPTWETRCWGKPVAGTVLPVSCDPLVATGTAPKPDQ